MADRTSSGTRDRLAPDGRLDRHPAWNRPRNILAAILLLVAAVVGWVLWESVSHLGAKPNVAVDYGTAIHDLAAEHSARPVSRDVAMWVDFEEALSRYETIVAQHERIFDQHPDAAGRRNTIHSVLDFSYLRAGEEMPEDVGPERDAIAALAEAGLFANMRDIVTGPVPLRPFQEGEMILSRLMPDLPRSRAYANARAGSMRLALQDLDFHDAVDAVVELLALAQIMSLQGTLIDHLVGIAIATMIDRDVIASMTEYDWPEDAAERLFAALTEFPLPSIELALRGERNMMLDVVQHSFEDDGSGDGHMLPSTISGMETMTGPVNHPPGLMDAFASRFIMAARRETIDAFDRIFDEAISQSRLPTLETDLDSIDRLHASIGRANLASLLAPVASKALAADHLHRVQHEGARVMAAIELFRAREGRFPEALDELVPGIFHVVPVDPTHGGSFGYRLLEEPDEHGRNYLLYSTGLDQTDDGGRMVDWRARSTSPFEPLNDRDLQGFDFIINMPRGEW